jgi:predicted nucleotidyltransferase
MAEGRPLAMSAVLSATFVAEICRRHNVRRLDLFGSAVGPNFDPRTSDLDFLVEFGVFTQGEYSEHYFALIEDLKSLFGRPVEVVVSRAVRNPYLRESINRTREALYAS